MYEQYCYLFALLFFVQLTYYKSQAQRLLSSDQNVCDVVEPTEDHTSYTSINVGESLTITQSSCVQNFQVTIGSSSYIDKYLQFEIIIQASTPDVRFQPLLLEKTGELPVLLVNSTGGVYFESDAVDSNGFANRKTYQNIVIEPSQVILDNVYYFSLYYYTDDTDTYLPFTNTYKVQVQSTNKYPCPNDCSGKGDCDQNLKKCICDPGYFDLDCSVFATELSYSNFEPITLQPQQSQLFYTTLHGPVQNLKIYFNKSDGDVDLFLRINPKNTFDLPNAENLIGEDQLSYSLSSTYHRFVNSG